MTPTLPAPEDRTRAFLNWLRRQSPAYRDGLNRGRIRLRRRMAITDSGNAIDHTVAAEKIAAGEA